MRSLIARSRHALMFFAAGAVVAYFLDPESGAERRRPIVELLSTFSDRPDATPSPSVPATPGDLGVAVAYG